MSPLENLGIVLGLCAILSILAFKFKLMTTSGSVASFLIGVVIGMFGSVNWLVLLIVFVLLAFAVTRYKLEVKIKKGLQEGKKGERTYKNVLANGLVPAIIAVASWSSGSQSSLESGLVYLSAISVTAADTTASELGILSPRTRLITTYERVEPGSDGGVSLFGTSAALSASILSSILGWLIVLPAQPIDLRILIPISMGFLGCTIDSFIGATLERKGFVSKLGNNVASMASGSVIALIIISWL
ncbi:MAG: DUF92 domain-containing protein [Methanomassiliicoccales archaeon]|nr:DUF92 domain-containing protein [Methanomassiliicoccales archaeon]